MSDTASSSSIERSNAERKQIRKERLVLLRKNKAFVVGSAILIFWIPAIQLDSWKVGSNS